MWLRSKGVHGICGYIIVSSTVSQIHSGLPTNTLRYGWCRELQYGQTYRFLLVNSILLVILLTSHQCGSSVDNTFYGHLAETCLHDIPWFGRIPCFVPITRLSFMINFSPGSVPWNEQKGYRVKTKISVEVRVALHTSGQGFLLKREYQMINCPSYIMWLFLV